MNSPLKTRFESLYNEAAGAQVIAVTKYSKLSTLKQAYELGYRDFGENKVKDLQEKAEDFKTDNLNQVRWHFLGNIQSNKLSKLLKVPGLVSIHSVDRLSILEKILKKDSELKAPLEIFIQINTSGEKEKAGFEDMEEVIKALQLFYESTPKNIRLAGLMTLGAIRTENFEKSAQKSFSKLKTLKELLDQMYKIDLGLSMGMSADYKLALELGATHIRVGSALFK